MKKVLLVTTLLSTCLLSACGNGETKVDPLTYIYLNDENSGEHYEVYYNGLADLPETTVIASTYNDGKNGEHPVTGFYYNEETEKGAFEGCSSLRNINVPNSITSVSKNAFKECKKLLNFELDYDSEITSVGERAFYNCTSLAFYRVNPKLKSIGDSAFALCDSMVSLYDYDYCTVETIGDAAFLNDHSLLTVPYFNDVKIIGKDAFSRCFAVESISLPSITYIGEGAFSRCHNMSTFQFGQTCTIEEIPNSCFFECRSLTSIGIPYKVDTISDYAFAYCSGLSYIDGGMYIKNIGKGAFQNCSAIVDTPISEFCVSIGNDAFRDCSSLSEIVIPKTTTSIGSAVFNGCRNIKSLKVDPDNPNYDSRNDCNAIITKVDIEGDETILANTLIAACPISTIPSSVNNILPGTYMFNNGMKEIHIPNTITDSYSFMVASCYDLETLVFDSGSQIKTLVENTIFDLTKVKTIVLPDSLETIKRYALYNITYLDELTIPTTVTKIESRGLNYVYDLGVIHYNGTKAQFAAIDKAEDWVNGSLNTLVVRCTDGDISVYE